METCKNCGKRNPINAKFCGKCGEMLNIDNNNGALDSTEFSKKGVKYQDVMSKGMQVLPIVMLIGIHIYFYIGVKLPEYTIIDTVKRLLSRTDQTLETFYNISLSSFLLLLSGISFLLWVILAKRILLSYVDYFIQKIAILLTILNLLSLQVMISSYTPSLSLQSQVSMCFFSCIAILLIYLIKIDYQNWIDIIRIITLSLLLGSLLSFTFFGVLTNIDEKNGKPFISLLLLFINEKHFLYLIINSLTILFLILTIWSSVIYVNRIGTQLGNTKFAILIFLSGFLLVLTRIAFTILFDRKITENLDFLEKRVIFVLLYPDIMLSSLSFIALVIFFIIHIKTCSLLNS